jgi:uncharacterized RDD family membrane protein YckC
LKHPSAPLGRRFLSIFYEALALTAFVWAMAFVYSAVEQTLHLAHVRPVFQVYLLVVIGIYFVWQWLRGGQTLAMRTWRLSIERSDGKPLGAAQAVGRYLLATAGTIALGVTYWWGFFDRDRAFLHDRLAGTRVIRL